MGSMVEAFMSWLTFAPNLAAMLIIATLGEIAKKLVLGPKSKWPAEGFKGLKGVYWVTYKAHAIVAGVLGAALGSLVGGLPVPEMFVTDGLAGAMLNYGGDGAAAMVLHASLWGNGKTFMEMLRKRASGGA